MEIEVYSKACAKCKERKVSRFKIIGDNSRKRETDRYFLNAFTVSCDSLLTLLRLANRLRLRNKTRIRFSVSEPSCCLFRVARKTKLTTSDQCRILHIHKRSRLNSLAAVFIYLEDCTLLFGIVVVTDITAAISHRCVHLWKRKEKRRERKRKSEEFCSPFVQVSFTNEINERITKGIVHADKKNASGVIHI